LIITSSSSPFFLKTGFDFKAKVAAPVLSGIVVAAIYEETVKDVSIREFLFSAFVLFSNRFLPLLDLSIHHRPTGKVSRSMPRGKRPRSRRELSRTGRSYSMQLELFKESTNNMDLKDLLQVE